MVSFQFLDSTDDGETLMGWDVNVCFFMVEIYGMIAITTNVRIDVIFFVIVEKPICQFAGGGKMAEYRVYACAVRRCLRARDVMQGLGHRGHSNGVLDIGFRRNRSSGLCRPQWYANFRKIRS